MYLSPSFQSIYLPDILTIIAFHLPWRSLRTWKYWPGFAPAIAETESRNRVEDVLSPYFPDCLISKFFDLLENSRGAVVGSVTLELLLSGEPFAAKEGASRCLDILVHNQLGDLFHTFFVNLGYVSHTEAPARRHGSKVESVEVYVKDGADGHSAKVYVAVSEGTALEALLASSNTTRLNAITNGLVISFYPRLTWKNEGLRLIEDEADGEDDPYDASVVYGSDIFSINSHWKRDCGIWCPMTRRKTYDDSGVAKYTWRVARLGEKSRANADAGWDVVSADPRDMDITYHKSLQWTVSETCSNPKCTQRMLYELRSRCVNV